MEGLIIRFTALMASLEVTQRKGVGGEIIIFGGEFVSGVTTNDQMLNNGGVLSSKYMGGIFFEASIPKPIDMSSASLSIDDFVNWSLYINGNGGRDANGNPLNLSSMVSQGFDADIPFMDWGAINGANTYGRKITLPNGTIAKFIILDPNFRP